MLSSEFSDFKCEEFKPGFSILSIYVTGVSLFIKCPLDTGITNLPKHLCIETCKCCVKYFTWYVPVMWGRATFWGNAWRLSVRFTGVRVKGCKSKSYSRTVIATSQPAFQITSNMKNCLSSLELTCSFRNHAFMTFWTDRWTWSVATLWKLFYVSSTSSGTGWLCT
jgi:hypothetical protein